MAEFKVLVERLVIEEHPNADRLELARVGDYQSIVLKDQFETGALAAYIPEAALVPEEILEELVILPLALSHHWSQNMDAGAGFEGGEATDDLVAGLSADLAAALNAVRGAAAGEEHAEIVVDFGDRADGRTRILPA